tara:strand:+ start:134 stop:727 length:594 start_codon:yes stop_codon:yes gene_type:complete
MVIYTTTHYICGVCGKSNKYGVQCPCFEKEMKEIEIQKEKDMEQLEYEMYEEAQEVIDNHKGGFRELLHKVCHIGFPEDSSLKLIEKDGLYAHELKLHQQSKEEAKRKPYMPTENIETKYRGYTIIINKSEGSNPFGCSQQRMGVYPKTCIVPDGEYKWQAVTWHVKAAKWIIDYWKDDMTQERFDHLNRKGDLIAE